MEWLKRGAKLLILLLIPVTITFNGCGEEKPTMAEYAPYKYKYPCYEVIKEHPTHGIIRIGGVGNIGGLNTMPAPTYPVGLDTVGWEDVWKYMSPPRDTVSWVASNGKTYRYTVSSWRLDSSLVWQPITERIMKPLELLYLKPDQKKRLMELLEPPGGLHALNKEK